MSAAPAGAGSALELRLREARRSREARRELGRRFALRPNQRLAMQLGRTADRHE